MDGAAQTEMRTSRSQLLCDLWHVFIIRNSQSGINMYKSIVLFDTMVRIMDK